MKLNNSNFNFFIRTKFSLNKIYNLFILELILLKNELKILK